MPRMSLSLSYVFKRLDIDMICMRFSRYIFQGLITFSPMGLSGLEPPTSRLSGVRSNRLSYKPSAIQKGFPDFFRNGDEEIRTLDPLLARQVLSQLSYIPKGSGSHLLSHTVSSAVPSAALVLTIVFGMGTGVSPKRIATRNIRLLSKCINRCC